MSRTKAKAMPTYIYLIYIVFIENWVFDNQEAVTENVNLLLKKPIAVDRLFLTREEKRKGQKMLLVSSPLY
jgi:hypothetical protein